jgi:hypothetical protein
MATFQSAIITTPRSFTATTPYRQIRAHYDDEDITVYQAYSAEIGDAAVKHQKLSASTSFSYGRMTWIKPSFSWMCYRAGYSYKDSRQARILAIKMKHDHFIELLRQAFVGHGAPDSTEAVRVQWDPERTPAMQKLPWRSIQIGIPRSLSQKWVEEWIVSIEDVTERAKALKQEVDEHPNVQLDELLAKDIVPVESIYEVPDDVKEILKMDEPKS